MRLHLASRLARRWAALEQLGSVPLFPERVPAKPLHRMEAPEHHPRACANSHGACGVLFAGIMRLDVWLAKESLGEAWIQCRGAIQTKGLMRRAIPADICQVSNLVFTNTESQD